MCICDCMFVHLFHCMSARAYEKSSSVPHLRAFSLIIGATFMFTIVFSAYALYDLHPRVLISKRALII